jgi:hypothetical protein
MYCPHCGNALSEDSRGCSYCGFGAGFKTSDIGQNATARMLLPVGRSVWAILAGYAGLLSVLVLPAPFALAFGIIALVDIKNHPTKHGKGRAIFGIVMGGIFSLVFLLTFGVGIIGAWMSRR